MEFIQLRHFLAAVQYGNLIKAAEESNISQSGLSRSIKNLETRLGAPLLIRKPNGVEPTAFGTSLIRRANVIISEVSRAVTEIKDIQAGDVGDVTIGITNNYSFHIMPDVIADYLRTRKDVRIKVVVRSFPELIDMLKFGELDFAFGLLGPVEHSEDIDIQEICDSHARVIAGRKHPWAKRAKISKRELASAKWAMFDSESFQQKFTSFFTSESLKLPSQLLKTNSVVILKSLLASLDVLTVLPVDMVRQEISSGEFVILNCDTPASYARAGLIFRTGSLVTPQMQQLSDCIRKAATREAS